MTESSIIPPKYQMFAPSAQHSEITTTQDPCFAELSAFFNDENPSQKMPEIEAVEQNSAPAFANLEVAKSGGYSLRRIGCIALAIGMITAGFFMNHFMVEDIPAPVPQPKGIFSWFRR